MSFVKTKGFKYLKNLIIGVGASVVLTGALFKIESWPYASEMLTAGLLTEAFLFLMLGVLGPEKDYYWEKLYPGLDVYDSHVQALSAEGAAGSPLNGEAIEGKLGSMLTELQGMHKSLSSLKALQEVDFSGTSAQIKQMSNFYTKMSEAMADLTDSAGDVKAYKDQLSSLNKNLGSLNTVYGSMLTAMSNIGK
ncbi:MAG: gliding motility protein GldL [Saprospiraceae bacterium]